jgi:tetratricopeptide (TPR) repeat protein
MQAARTSGVDVREVLGLAAACAKRGELEPAMVHLKRLLDAEPNHEIGNGMLAGIYAQLQMTERAQECYERVLTVNPGNALARLQLGLLQLNSGREQEALQTWQPSLVDNQDFMAHFYSGLTLTKLGRRGEAQVLLQRSAQRMPANHPLYQELRTLLTQLQA